MFNTRCASFRYGKVARSLYACRMSADVCSRHSWALSLGPDDDDDDGDDDDDDDAVFHQLRIELSVHA